MSKCLVVLGRGNQWHLIKFLLRQTLQAGGAWHAIDAESSPPAGIRGSHKTRGCLLKQVMSDWPWVATTSADGCGGEIRALRGAWRGMHNEILMFGQGGVKIAAMTCATGGRWLAIGGDRDCLLFGSREPEYCQAGLLFIQWGLHGRAHAVRWDLQDPWTAQALSFKGSGSWGTLLSCAYACSMVLSALSICQPGGSDRERATKARQGHKGREEENRKQHERTSYAMRTCAPSTNKRLRLAAPVPWWQTVTTRLNAPAAPSQSAPHVSYSQLQSATHNAGAPQPAPLPDEQFGSVGVSDGESNANLRHAAARHDMSRRPACGPGRGAGLACWCTHVVMTSKKEAARLACRETVVL
eukprot:366073-Chlamydomonas_euryale.AAC.4